jgi:hypothetical protein
MYCGWHKRLSKVAWVLVTLSILTAIVYLIVGVAGGWNCDFSCSENDGGAQLLNEGIYSCHSDKHGDPEVSDGSGAHFTPGLTLCTVTATCQCYLQSGHCGCKTRHNTNMAACNVLRIVLETSQLCARTEV